ncbi:MAG: valine--tRNA ligase [Firmicutes bacterium]|nr:valine--tRNA ligase [Bacillota bacterium]
MAKQTQTQGLPTVFDPKAVEEKWYNHWKEKGYFHAEVDKSKEPFSIVIPPPNVTGQLHMGHAMDNTMQDILVRWKRMQGYNTVWIPGTDHAGIATQIKVEEALREEEGLTRHDLGREKFLERVWAWKEKYGNRIREQLETLGVSCDWERERFTMDEGCSKAVREVFVELYNKGLIYQGSYIINWCPRCNTALSDVEVEHEEQQGKIWHIKYPLKNGQGYITIATTRPETMLGDTALAVNPQDERYQDLISETVILPLMNREIPIIADDYVDMEFGTGVVKITPGHDPNDFEVGMRHGLEIIMVIGEDGSITEAGGKYAGMDRYEARRAVVQDLTELGLLEKVEEHQHAVGGCQRCGTTVEPLVSKQWFVKMKPLAKPAIEAVEQGKVRFVPERFAKNYLHWMENIRDWCISRQLWWGHRIPVWYCQDCDEVIVAKEDPTSCSKCGSQNLEQDPDGLDTWFSSALWPFSTMGWPEQTPELEHFYPTSVLVTGFDIIYFWVARMIFTGIEFMGEVPFPDVLIHGLVRDAQGRKMSKSLGNGVDPIEVIEEYGADALRFTLVTGTSPGNDTRYEPEKVEASRNFANKIWNASRFALMNLTDFDPEAADLEALELSLPDRWILSRYQTVIREVTRRLTRYELGEAARELYDFIWSEFCDWYIELVKPRLYGRFGDGAKATSQYVLWSVLRGTLELLHPYMPFLTEEIWQQLPHQGETIMLASWPKADEQWDDPQAEQDMETVMELIRAIRNVRAENQVAPGKTITAIVHASPEKQQLVTDSEEYLKTLGKISELTVAGLEADKPEKVVTAIAAGIEIYLPLADLVDLEQEIQRLQGELEKTQQEISRSQGKLANEGFVNKAPEAVVDKERAKLAALLEQEERIRARLAELQE